jgi:hypothetical protein
MECSTAVQEKNSQNCYFVCKVNIGFICFWVDNKLSKEHP